MGEPDQIERLAGMWSGEYIGDSGSSGTILFQLEAGRDTATGDILMIPREWHRVQTDGPGTGNAASAAPRTLTIQFVRIADGLVVGNIGPYADRETGEMLAARFEGHVRGDKIEGTYVTFSPSGHGLSSGEWKVVRRADPDPAPVP